MLRRTAVPALLALASLAVAEDVSEALSRVDEQLKSGRRTEALAGAKSLVERHPDSLPGHILYQDLARAGGGESDLVQIYAARAKEKPDDVNARYLHARLLSGTRAVSEFRAVLRVDRRFVPGLVGLARALEAVGRNKDAESAARKAVALAPTGAPGHDALGWILEQRGDDAEAEKSYRRALECDAEFRSALINLAHVLSRNGKTEDALSQIGRAQALGPGDPQILVHRGIVLATLGRDDEAAKVYIQAVEKAPDDALILVLLAESYIELSKWELAADALDRAEAIDEKLASVPATRGYAALRRGKLNAAIAGFTAATRLEPKEARHVYYLALAYESAGKKATVATFNKAIRMAPDNPLYRMALGNTLETGGRLKEALAAYKEATRLAPEDVDAWIRYGHAAAETRRSKVAIKAFLEAYKLDPDDLDLLKSIGIVYEIDLRDAKKAIEFYLLYQGKGGKDPRVAEWLEQLGAGT